MKLPDGYGIAADPAPPMERITWRERRHMRRQGITPNMRDDARVVARLEPGQRPPPSDPGLVSYR